MDAHRQASYLRLYHSNWLSHAALSRLLKVAGNVASLFTASDDVLLSYGLTSAQIKYFRAIETGDNAAVIDRELAWAEQSGNTLLCYEDPQYPPLLKELDVAPALLYVCGDVSALIKPQIAIVGSRKASNYGLRNAYWMAHDLGSFGLAVSSGLARGIDTQAHLGALAAGQSTIAVVGTGIDRVYPPSNTELAARIVQSGAIVSEFALGTPPVATNFPRRNRIMSGLCIATLVIEAAVKSGSLITARLALEQNRDVFAIPGLISNPLAAGCHALINDGARLVQNPQDILQELDQQLAFSGGLQHLESGDVSTVPSKRQPDQPVNSVSIKTRTGSAALADLLKLIGDEGVELQYLLNNSGRPYQDLIQQLLALEIQGEIRVESGRYYRN